MRNIAVNAILNNREKPPTLFVHGSIMTYRLGDKVIISKPTSQRTNNSILVLDVRVLEGNGPSKGMPRPFNFEISGETANTYNQVTVVYSNDASVTVNVEVTA